MDNIKRGDIYFITGGVSVGSEQSANRPGIVVTNDTGNRFAPVVGVVYLTSRQKNPLPTHVRIVCEVPSIALCEQVHTVSKNRLKRRMGHITEREQREIDEALKVSLAIENERMVPVNELQLVKSENFGEIQCDIYSGGDEMFMTANQLCECLQEPRSTFDNRMSRNPHLKESEFSVSLKMRGTDGKRYDTRVFTEDGIYEITMMSESPNAKEFRAWIRKVLKSLRKGEAVLTPAAELERIKIQAQQDRARAMLLNAQNRTLKTLMAAIPDKKLSPIAIEVFGLKSIQEATGIDMGQYLPACEQTYSATEVGAKLGVTANRIGKIANRHGLKRPEYGVTVMDKSPYSNKEVPAFRYNQRGVDMIEAMLRQAG